MEKRPAPPARTPIEQEVIFLNAILDLIDSMVSFEVLQVIGTSPDANILFHTSTHQRFFNILLVDLLAKSDRRVVGKEVPYLQALREISESPHFDKDGSVCALRTATEGFCRWLEEAPTVLVWVPSIEQEIELAMPRKTSLAICGNISKHSVLRLSRPAKQVLKMLEDAGTTVSLDEAVLALEDFYERFHTDIFNYHGSTIAEFLNEIRWGIHEYLLPEFRRSYSPRGGDPPRCEYLYPDGVSTELGKALYWDLMNRIRGRPCLERFQVTRYLKQRY